MAGHPTASDSFVIKALDLPACHYLADDCPKPHQLEWIDRGTDRALRQSTIEQLARTFHKDKPSPSISRIQHSAGLLVTFASDRERTIFAQYFKAAVDAERSQRQHLVAALFHDSDQARDSIVKLIAYGIPSEALCVMEKVADLQDDKLPRLQGHSMAAVGRTTLAGGVLGVMLGAAILAVPGLGAIAVTSAIVGQAVSLVTTITGIIGASGGAISKMLSDFDVHGRSTNHFAGLVARGGVLVTIDTRLCTIPTLGMQQLIVALGGQLVGRSWPFDMRLQASEPIVTQVTTAPAPMATPYGTPLTDSQVEALAFLRSNSAGTTSANPASEIHQTRWKNASKENQRADAA